jgi:hypothetical protein
LLFQGLAGSNLDRTDLAQKCRTVSACAFLAVTGRVWFERRQSQTGFRRGAP